MCFTGSDWEFVGNPGFTASYSNYISLAFSLSGTPYVAHQGNMNIQQATIMKFDGADWVVVGNENFSAGPNEFLSLTFSQTGPPFVAFSDYANSSKATVMYLDSSSGIDDQKESNVSLYPNPASKNLTIDLTNFIGKNRTIEITDINRTQVYSAMTRKKQIVVDVENYNKGIYFVTVRSNDQSVTEGS